MRLQRGLVFGGVEIPLTSRCVLFPVGKEDHLVSMQKMLAIFGERGITCTVLFNFLLQVLK